MDCSPWGSRAFARLRAGRDAGTELAELQSLVDLLRGRAAYAARAREGQAAAPRPARAGGEDSPARQPAAPQARGDLSARLSQQSDT